MRQPDSSHVTLVYGLHVHMEIVMEYPPRREFCTSGKLSRLFYSILLRDTDNYARQW
jgi:hypothetical protein